MTTSTRRRSTSAATRAHAVTRNHGRPRLVPPCATRRAPGQRRSSAVHTSAASVSIPPTDGGNRRVTNSGLAPEAVMGRDATRERATARLLSVAMIATGERSFYETEYHFGQDVEQPGATRLRRALDLLGPLRGTAFLDLGSGVGWAANLASGDGAKVAVGA